jgi:hypothetical protein
MRTGHFTYENLFISNQGFILLMTAIFCPLTVKTEADATGKESIFTISKTNKIRQTKEKVKRHRSLDSTESNALKMF